MLKLINITKEYDNEKVLYNINISFKEKEFVSILGPSGSGKTTLLNILGGIDTSYEGKVLFYNHNLKVLNENKLNSYRSTFVSFIFQDYNLIDILSVYENIKLPLLLKNKSNREIEIIINTTLNMLDINNIKDKYPKDLSGGQKQRVAIARAIVSDTKIILCDEVTSALDINNSINIFNILKRLSKDKLVILITHNKKLAYKYSDRVLYLKNKTIKGETFNYKNKNIIFNKLFLNKLNIIKLSIKNILSHKKRTIITSLSFSISLISILLTLCISNSIKSRINILDEEIIKNFPIVVNSEIYKDKKKDIDKNVITTYSDKIYKNEITNTFTNLIEKNSTIYYKKNINLNITTYNNIPIDNSIFSIFPINYIKEDYSILKGAISDDKYKLVIEVNSNNEVDPVILNIFNIENSINIKDLIGKSIKLNGNNSYINLKVEAIIKPKYNSNNSYIYLKKDLINSDINSISIYNKNIKEKDNLINKITKYNRTNKKIIYEDPGSVFTTSVNIIVKSITNGLVIFSFVSLVTSFFMIISVIYLSILENKKNIGIFKTIGIRNKDINNIFKYEFIIISIISSCISTVFIKILIIIINFILCRIINIKDFIVVSFREIIIISIISILTSILASLYPSKKINKKNIKELLK